MRNELRTITGAQKTTHVRSSPRGVHVRPPLACGRGAARHAPELNERLATLGVDGRVGLDGPVRVDAPLAEGEEDTVLTM